MDNLYNTETLKHIKHTRGWASELNESKNISVSKMALQVKVEWNETEPKTDSLI